ncbi:WYL domain-containing protein [Virgibacillus necropolis]|uniref:WYL domain-containing protein n=1 Tax=Virgibacillus necropolis TaxID=163877 RepID=A0A221MFI5_9BACI|nr:hypothetical protein [Virgibacillus necropolis]ASN06401.1 hypothetical protein CFK40_15925 [Virgibacillus necropolis]
MKNMLIRSIQSKEKIEMIYLSKDNQASQRIIRALKINDEMILAYCYTRRKVRTFKLENILSVGLVKKRMGA